MLKAVCVTVVLFCFTGDQLVGGDSNLDKELFTENYEDWIKLVSLAFKYGVPEAHQTIIEYLEELHGKCREDNYCRKALDFLQEMCRKRARRMKAVKLIGSIIKLPQLAQDILDKTISHPILYVTDAAQIILEMNGYEKTGKALGAAGCTLAGAAIGAKLGGPLGTFLGAGIGLGVWGIGEYYSNPYKYMYDYLRNPVARGFSVVKYRGTAIDRTQHLKAFAHYFEV